VAFDLASIGATTIVAEHDLGAFTITSLEGFKTWPSHVERSCRTPR
jgi:hypothetical protein